MECRRTMQGNTDTDDTTIESATRYHAGSYKPRHAVEISDPQDFSEAVEAAETLGLSLSKTEVCGAWRAHPDAGCGLGRGFYVDGIETAGRKWFHLRFDDGTVIRARPKQSEVMEDGTLRLLFD
jgi:hypothetical protein